MVTSCSAYCCTRRHDKGNNFEFFLFPGDQNFWTPAVRQKSWSSSKRCFVANIFKLVKDSMDPVCSISSLPDEILVEVFKYLTHNELGRISRVNKRWNECTKNPVLWKKVKVKFSWLRGSQNEIASSFAKKFSPSITYMKLDFWRGIWKKGLKFEQHCMKLKDMCPHLNTLILHYALLSVNFSSFMNLCSQNLPNLTALIVRTCDFAVDRSEMGYCDFPHIGWGEKDYCDFPKKEYSGHSKIEILDLSNCVNIPKSSMCSFSKMPSLRKLNLSSMRVTDCWFVNEVSPSFLHQLECLQLGYTEITTGTIRMLKKHALKLTELYLCNTEIYGDEFVDTVPPLLKTICIRSAKYVDGQGVAGYLQSCPSVENILVNGDMAEWYAEEPFAAANPLKFEILKVGPYCTDHEKLEFLLD